MRIRKHLVLEVYRIWGNLYTVRDITYLTTKSHSIISRRVQMLVTLSREISFQVSIE